MKFYEFVLSEGRRETLLKKYMGEYDMQTLDTILNDEFTKATNYKYVDWIFNHLDFASTTHALEVLQLVKDFDRIGKNLEKKDINQYSDVAELMGVIQSYTSKSQEKKIDSDAKKIYEDSRVLIVKPLSHKASCKYGAGTKWCTTQTSPGYYEKYTSGNQGLYYIIMKDFDISNKFYKIALHKGTNDDTWYDAQDTVMPPREVDVLKVGLGRRATKAIEDDFSENKNKVLKELFNPNNHHHVVVTNNLFGSKKPLTFEFTNPELVYEVEGFAKITFKAFLGSGDDEQKIEEGDLGISYVLSENTLNSDVGYMENDEFEPPVSIESIWRLDFSLPNFPLSVESDGGPFKRYCNILSSQIWRRVQNDESLKKYVLGGKKSWNPDRFNYGFTFQRKGLINKLVDYLDSGKEGNAIDFLEDAKVITIFVNPDGTKKYLGRKGYIEPKGYFSSFFASAVKAGILSYTRKNKKNILTKGPNFDDFKEGNLVPL